MFPSTNAPGGRHQTMCSNNDATTALQVVDPKSTKEDDKKWASSTKQGIKYQVDASRRLEPRSAEPYMCMSAMHDCFHSMFCQMEALMRACLVWSTSDTTSEKVSSHAACRHPHMRPYCLKLPCSHWETVKVLLPLALWAALVVAESAVMCKLVTGSVDLLSNLDADGRVIWRCEWMWPDLPPACAAVWAAVSCVCWAPLQAVLQVAVAECFRLRCTG